MSFEIVSNSEIGEFVARATGGIYDPRTGAAIGLIRNGRIEAGILFENWNRASVMCHIAIRGRLVPQYLHAIADYPFRQLGVRKVIAPIYNDNLRMRRIVEKMGFFEEARLHGAQPNGDIVLYTLMKKQCKYLGDRYGVRRLSADAFQHAAAGA